MEEFIAPADSLIEENPGYSASVPCSILEYAEFEKKWIANRFPDGISPFFHH